MREEMDYVRRINREHAELGRQLLPKAGVESGAMVPVEIAPEDGRPRRPDREGVIEIAFGCGARVRLRGEVSSETLRQVIELRR
jgi:hypothetical protein